MSKNPVVHFEMPYKDGKRVAEFYKKVFGWKMDETPPEMGGYVLAGSIDVDKDNMPLQPGGINGGFYPLKDAPASPEPSVVISVPNLNKAMDDIKAAGGEVTREPNEIPGIGMWAVFKDSEGNRVSILEAKRG